MDAKERARVLTERAEEMESMAEAMDWYAMQHDGEDWVVAFRDVEGMLRQAAKAFTDAARLQHHPTGAAP